MGEKRMSILDRIREAFSDPDAAVEAGPASRNGSAEHVESGGAEVLAAVVALAIPAMGWAIEYLGSTTGFPFGRYHYTDRLQPQLGHVPLLIPLAWLMMLPPAWAVAGSIAGNSGLSFVLASALALPWLWRRAGTQRMRLKSAYSMSMSLLICESLFSNAGVWTSDGNLTYG